MRPELRLWWKTEQHHRNREKSSTGPEGLAPIYFKKMLSQTLDSKCSRLTHMIVIRMNIESAYLLDQRQDDELSTGRFHAVMSLLHDDDTRTARWLCLLQLCTSYLT